MSVVIFRDPKTLVLNDIVKHARSKTLGYLFYIYTIIPEPDRIAKQSCLKKRILHRLGGKH